VDLESQTQADNVPPHLGIAGTGRMGNAMGMRLLECGVRLVVWNRHSAATESLVAQGAVRASTLHELTQNCGQILTSLSDDAALEDVYCGPQGLLRGPAQGKLFIDTSTVSPSTVVRIGQAAEEVGASFIDAPVLGTVAPARAGRLIVMAGGRPEHIAAARATLGHIAGAINHVGDVGSGAAMKLAINLPMAAYWAAMADSFALAQAAKLDVAQLVKIIADSPAALAQLESKLPVVLGHSAQVGYDIQGVLKDCDVIKRVAAANGLRLPMLDGMVTAFAAAVTGGWGGRDVAAVPRFQLKFGVVTHA
jgi:3-hydroxyisobutyrate dehydrogenase